MSGVREVLVHTGQHYDANMSRVFFDELGIAKPDYNLGIGSLSHGAQTGRMLEAVESVLEAANPDWVVVYGDTNSTLAGALAAAKLHIPVAHVEAGLRSFDRRMPEEVNRLVADHVADLLLVPTQQAMRNLEREGVPAGDMRLVGDVMYDAALLFGDRAKRDSRIVDRLGLEPGAFAVATVHRAENTDDGQRLRAVVGGLRLVGERLPVVFPVHGRTKAALAREGLWRELAAPITTVEPVSYLDMTGLVMASAVVITDSGGLQKEAFFHRVPCVTLREQTEWVELLELGWNRLAPPSSAAGVVSAVSAALDAPRGREGSPYGHGDAAPRIASALLARAEAARPE